MYIQSPYRFLATMPVAMVVVALTIAHMFGSSTPTAEVHAGAGLVVLGAVLSFFLRMHVRQSVERRDQRLLTRTISGLHCVRICAFLAAASMIMAASIAALTTFSLIELVGETHGMSASGLLWMLALFGAFVPPAVATSYFNSHDGDLPMSWVRVNVIMLIQALSIVAFAIIADGRPLAALIFGGLACVVMLFEGQQVFPRPRGDWT